MAQAFARTEMLLGKEAMEKLSESNVAVFGLGGVGGYVVEALARSGVGGLFLVDNDVFSESNLNRQILATRDTLGQKKTDIAARRVLSINPQCRVTTRDVFFLPENAAEFDFSSFDYVVDAIDTVSAKIALVLNCRQTGTPILSCMGTGNKLDPSRLQIADLYKTSVCPLARVMRTELRKRGVKKLKVLYSTETPIKPGSLPQEETPGPGKRSIPGSSAFVPPAAGLLIASEVVKDLIGYRV